MKLRHILYSACVLSVSCMCYAQVPDRNLCLNLLQQAETSPNPTLYSQCGFDDEKTAMEVWAPLARENKLAHALYEICMRHPKHPDSNRFCAEAAKLGDGSAVAWAGDIYYKKNDIPKAMSYYNYALQRGGLTEDLQGQIITNLAVLYANPESPYHDAEQSVPLLQQAASKNSALANNILGYMTFFGENGVKKDSKEAFANFWRAILLGCPAAEENLGFLQLVEHKQLDPSDAKKAMSSRLFSCDASADKTVILGGTTVNVYHLSFTPQECSDINYYAERLIDSSRQFTGKKECAFSNDMAKIINFFKPGK